MLAQTTTTSWPAPRLLATRIAPIIIGLCVLVASAWTSPPSLALFLTGAVVAGAGLGGVSVNTPADRNPGTAIRKQRRIERSSS